MSASTQTASIVNLLPTSAEHSPPPARGRGWLLSMSVKASGKETSGSTYLWKSIGGDFKASSLGGKEPDKKTQERFHFVGRRCQGVRRGVLGESHSSLNRVQRDSGATQFVFKKWGEKRGRKLSNFVQKRNKYLFWSSDVSRGVGRTPRGYSNSRAGGRCGVGTGQDWGQGRSGTRQGPVGVTLPVSPVSLAFADLCSS